MSVSFGLASTQGVLSSMMLSTGVPAVTKRPSWMLSTCVAVPAIGDLSLVWSRSRSACSSAALACTIGREFFDRELGIAEQLVERAARSAARPSCQLQFAVRRAGWRCRRRPACRSACFASIVLRSTSRRLSSTDSAGRARRAAEATDSWSSDWRNRCARCRACSCACRDRELECRGIDIEQADRRPRRAGLRAPRCG